MVRIWLRSFFVVLIGWHIYFFYFLTFILKGTITQHSKRSEPRPSQFKPQTTEVTAREVTARRQSFSSPWREVLISLRTWRSSTRSEKRTKRTPPNFRRKPKITSELLSSSRRPFSAHFSLFPLGMVCDLLEDGAKRSRQARDMCREWSDAIFHETGPNKTFLVTPNKRMVKQKPGSEVESSNELDNSKQHCTLIDLNSKCLIR